MTLNKRETLVVGPELDFTIIAHYITTLTTKKTLKIKVLLWRDFRFSKVLYLIKAIHGRHKSLLRHALTFKHNFNICRLCYVLIVQEAFVVKVEIFADVTSKISNIKQQNRKPQI